MYYIHKIWRQSHFSPGKRVNWVSGQVEVPGSRPNLVDASPTRYGTNEAWSVLRWTVAKMVLSSQPLRLTAKPERPCAKPNTQEDGAALPWQSRQRRWSCCHGHMAVWSLGRSWISPDKTQAGIASWWEYVFASCRQYIFWSRPSLEDFICLSLCWQRHKLLLWGSKIQNNDNRRSSVQTCPHRMQYSRQIWLVGTAHPVLPCYWWGQDIAACKISFLAHHWQDLVQRLDPRMETWCDMAR